MTRTAMKKSALEKQLRKIGYVVLPLLDEHDITSLSDVYASVAVAHNEGFMASVLLDDKVMRARIHTELCAVFDKKLLPHLVDFRMVVGSIAAKEPNSEDSSVGLHQDLTFVDERHAGQISLSIWAPLQPVMNQNGCLSVAKGSHLLNRNWRDPSSLPYRDLVDVIEQEFMTELPMNAGDVLIMDSRLFHASPPNRSPRARAVAAGIAAPSECPIHYVHRDHGGDPSVVEIWEVPADFYQYQTIGMRPNVGRHLDTIPATPEPLDEARLRAELTPVAKSQNQTVSA